MKKIIFLFLFAGLLATCGCSEDEVIEIYEAQESSYALNEHVKTETLEDNKSDGYAASDGKSSEVSGDEKDNIVTTAENILVDDSRPFVVFVTGEVNEPGVYELDEGSRIIDAIDIAGGYTSNACENYLNLAEYVADEQMIYVPTEVEVCEMKAGESNRLTEAIEAENARMAAGDAGGSQSGGSNNNGDKVNINIATKEQLMTLPGVGEAKADKIIAFREANGGFNTPEDIMQISGIKEKMYEKIKDGICVK